MMPVENGEGWVSQEAIAWCDIPVDISEIFRCSFLRFDESKLL